MSQNGEKPTIGDELGQAIGAESLGDSSKAVNELIVETQVAIIRKLCGGIASSIEKLEVSTESEAARQGAEAMRAAAANVARQIGAWADALEHSLKSKK